MRTNTHAGTLAVVLLCTSPAWAAEIAERMEAEANAGVGSFGSRYTDFTLTFSPYSSYYESGLKFRFGASRSYYTYPAPDASQSKGRDTQAYLLMGYGFQFDRWSLLLLAGPSLTWSDQTPGDLSPPSETARAGVKTVVSVFANPTDRTMLYGQSTYSSENHAYYTQLKFGGAILPQVFVGPELGFSGRAIMDGLNVMSLATDLGQWKVGGFLSGLTLGTLQFGFSAGYLRDRQQGSGAYFGTSVRATF